jgi:hypothetical protein
MPAGVRVGMEALAFGGIKPQVLIAAPCTHAKRRRDRVAAGVAARAGAVPAAATGLRTFRSFFYLLGDLLMIVCV